MPRSRLKIDPIDHVVLALHATVDHRMQVGPCGERPKTLGNQNPSSYFILPLRPLLDIVDWVERKVAIQIDQLAVTGICGQR